MELDLLWEFGNFILFFYNFTVLIIIFLPFFCLYLNIDLYYFIFEKFKNLVRFLRRAIVILPYEP